MVGRCQLRWEFFTPPAADLAPLDFSVDTDPRRMQPYSAVYDTYADATLAAFRSRGGKLMFLHRLADSIFSANDAADYYERLAANHGGLANAQSFARGSSRSTREETASIVPRTSSAQTNERRGAVGPAVEES